MKIEVNIQKKYAVMIVVAFLVLAGVLIVFAYGTNNPSVVGHSAGEIEMSCFIARGFESTTISLISYVGDDPGIPVSDLVTFRANGANLIPGPYIAADYFGVSCNSGWVMTGCTHIGYGIGDSDVLLSNNGCYANENDGASGSNSVDVVCCKG